VRRYRVIRISFLNRFFLLLRTHSGDFLLLRGIGTLTGLINCLIPLVLVLSADNVSSLELVA
jgi:hypothetical protein